MRMHIFVVMAMVVALSGCTVVSAVDAVGSAAVEAASTAVDVTTDVAGSAAEVVVE